MNMAASRADIEPQFVHESEAQRQYARVRIPAKLFVNLGGSTHNFPVADLSAGGFSVNTGLERFVRAGSTRVAWCSRLTALILPLT